MKPPCEIVVRHLLPTLRAMVAKELTERYNLKQEESAKKLGITQSAISYYLSENRGFRDIKKYRMTLVKENPRVKAVVKKIAKAIAEDRLSTVETIPMLCETCRALRSAKDICQMHIGTTPSLEKTCNICLP